MGIKVIK
ncbi:uncharacterized protein FFE2_02236 [Fusarium fujikuroi]|nr:uncharacterized protein FFE2_02236 [Fusarium fujikuroi]SCO14261.1 uncharacterized protein FFC1_12101 [Fusarium fujikuroi]SCV54336.1 uncharacterized protein FFFS_11208 [Fusarium fujikuroi]